MSIRSITVQYVGDVLFLPKLERDVKLVVERDYGTADPDKRFVMERTCRTVEDSGVLHCSECGAGAEKRSWAYWKYCPNCGARVIEEKGKGNDGE